MGKRCPADAIHIADIEGEGCLLAKEGDTHAQIISMEVVLSWQHPQTPHPIIHAQTIGTEPEAILGKPGAIKEGAHTHNNHVEPDLKEGQPGDPNTNTPEGVTHSELDSIPEETDLNVLAHLEGAGPEVLMDAEEDHSLEVEEDGTAGKTLSVKGDMDPHIRLQEPGVSCLPRKRSLDHSPCHHHHHPPPWRLLVYSAHWLLTQRHWPSQYQTTVWTWSRSCMTHCCCQMRPQNLPFTSCLSRSKPPPELEGCWSRSQVRNHSARWARGA